MNYFAGAPGSRHANMTEQLIRSVHLFSKHPIVVLHLGSRAPEHWTGKRFPRLSGAWKHVLRERFEAALPCEAHGLR